MSAERDLRMRENYDKLEALMLQTGAHLDDHSDSFVEDVEVDCNDLIVSIRDPEIDKVMCKTTYTICILP